MGTYDQGVKFTPTFRSEVNGVQIVHTVSSDLLLPSTPGPELRVTKMIASIK